MKNKDLIVLDDDALFHRIMTLANKHKVFKSVTSHYEVKPLLDYLWKNKDDHSNLPDVIFADLTIPVNDGWHFLSVYNRICDSLCKKIEVYIVTVSINAADSDRAAKYPFVKQYITKPVSMDQFREIAKVETV